MAQLEDLTPGRCVECIDGGVMHGARGIVQRNGTGLYEQLGFVWVVWENPHNRPELSPAWIKHTFVKVINQ